MNKKQRGKQEGPIMSFIIGQFAALLFATPTAILLWVSTNKYLAIWGPSNAFIGTTGFWSIIGFFAFVSTFLPRLFPSLLGKVWHGLIKAERWW